MHEISLESIDPKLGAAVTAIAVDDAGDVYAVYHLGKTSIVQLAEGAPSDVIRELDPQGDEGRCNPQIEGLALDDRGRPAVIGVEVLGQRLLSRIGAV